MDLRKLHILSLMVSVRWHLFGNFLPPKIVSRSKWEKQESLEKAKDWKSQIYLPSTELTISKPKDAWNKCCQIAPKAASRLGISPPELPVTASARANKQFKHKIFFMMHKCSLSHPKLEKTEIMETFFLLQIYAKTKEISFRFY